MKQLKPTDSVLKETSPADFFAEQLRIATEQEQRAQSRFNGLAIGRLAIFGGILFFLWLWNSQAEPLYGLVALGLSGAFVVVMKFQQTARRQRNFLRNLQAINTDELGRLRYQFQRPETGEAFAQPNHVYAVDLDIFGKHSLFSLINRTRTDEGSRRLAHWLTQHAALDEILLRQEAVAELQADPTWRQRWEATALLHTHAAQQVGALREWANERMDTTLQKSFLWRWWPLLTALLGGLAWASLLPGWLFWLSLLWHLVLIRRFQEPIQALSLRTTDLGHTLIAYADLIELANEVPFRSRWWKLRQTPAQQAGRAIRQLGDWFARLDYRLHPFFMVLIGIPFLWDLHCLAALESWKKEHGAELESWLDSLADFEALSSLAGFAFAHPDYPMPQVAWEDGVLVDAQQLGHPLIPGDKRVPNDFVLAGTGHTTLITGSNMSGKSTFLRTVGINLVLAQMGSVVCAQKLTCSPVQVFSSMRTQDSLEESTSSFYAELKRLRQLLELSAAATSTTPIFYLLDEILKGTNSADRHRGAEALIKQLHPMQASGLVSTHDLELGNWGAEQAFVRNCHFRSDVQDGKLQFDYSLYEGICRSFNASELMRMMGIAVPES